MAGKGFIGNLAAASFGAFIVLILTRGVLSFAPLLQVIALAAISYGTFLLIVTLLGLDEEDKAFLIRVFKHRHNHVEGWE